MRKRKYKRQRAEVRLKVQKSALKGLRNAGEQKISIYKRIREKFAKKKFSLEKCIYMCYFSGRLFKKGIS